jgi:hypothetical protein
MMQAKDIRKTSKGNTAIIYQDSPTTFHMSVSIGEYVIYDYLELPSSLEVLHAHIDAIEVELEEKLTSQT